MLALVQMSSVDVLEIAKYPFFIHLLVRITVWPNYMAILKLIYYKSNCNGIQVYFLQLHSKSVFKLNIDINVDIIFLLPTF